jgi:membrane protein implicated in regulation of membrane protease activity
MEFSPTLVWFLVGLGLVVAEIAIPGIILVFFGVAAWVVSITTYFGITSSIEVQLILFSIVSVLLLFTLRKFIRNQLTGHVTGEQNPANNLDEFAGKVVPVRETIKPGPEGGRVEFKGAEWKAVSEEEIEEGKMAVIIAADGITLKVKAS